MGRVPSLGIPGLQKEGRRARVSPGLGDQVRYYLDFNGGFFLI